MFKRGYRLFGILLLISVMFSVSSFVVNAQKQTTCLNPLGKNFCDNYNPTDQCYCDSKCEEYKDCCSDYQSVCKGGSTGGGGGGTSACGNGIRESNEVCDGNDLGGNTCTSLGYSQGQLKCQSNCVAFDTSGCVKEILPTDGNVTEAVTCVFEGSSKEEACTRAWQGFLNECKGIGSCVVKVSGKKGEQVTWKSSCGGYGYTTIDGVDEKVLFNCKQSQQCGNGICEEGEASYCPPFGYAPCTLGTCPSDCENKYKCVDSDNGINEFVAGKTYIDGTKDVHYDTCFYDQSNSLIEYSCFNNVIQKTQIQCKNGCKEGACLKQGQSQIKANAYKPYSINNPFFLSASGSSENSIIINVNWNHGPKDNPCKFTTKQDKGLKVSSNVYSEIEVTCNTPGLKSFIVTFSDDKGNVASDQVTVYVNEGKTSTITTPYGQPTTPSSTYQETKSTSNSCAGRCGFYDPKETCQCDDVCKDYGDCCLDKAQICG